MHSTRFNMMRRAKLAIQAKTAVVFSAIVAKTLIAAVIKALQPGASSGDALVALAQLDEFKSKSAGELDELSRALVAYWIDTFDFGKRAAGRVNKVHGTKTLVRAFQLLVVEFLGFNFGEHDRLSREIATALDKGLDVDGYVDLLKRLAKEYDAYPPGVKDLAKSLLEIHRLRAMTARNDADTAQEAEVFGSRLRFCLEKNLTPIAQLELAYELSELLA